MIPAFQQTAAGSGATVDTSFGASGTQTQAVINGLDTDIVCALLMVRSRHRFAGSSDH